MEKSLKHKVNEIIGSIITKEKYTFADKNLIADVARQMAIETASKLEAMKIQAEREETEKREKYILHIIKYLESKFSKNGGEPTYIDIFGLYEWVEKDLYGQYEFFQTSKNLYHVKRT